MLRLLFFLLLAFGSVYCHGSQMLNVDSARQSTIEVLHSERGSPSQCGKGDEEDRLGIVAASPHSKFEAHGSMSAASAESDACGKEIQLIDKQVQKLEKQKQTHQDLARQHQKLGDEWQYSSGNIQDAYGNWNRANQERRKAIDIQHEIDLLLQRKQRIIQFYPELYQP